MPLNYWGRQDDLKRLEKIKNRVTKQSTPGINKPVPLREKNNPKQNLAERKESLSRLGLGGNASPKGGTDSKSWTQQKFAGRMNVGDFVSLAGGLSQAIAPNTPQGRVGGLLANYVGNEKARLKEEEDYARGEEDRGLKRELTGLRIDKTKKDLQETKSPTEFAAYWRSETKKGTPSSDIVKNYKELGKTSTNKFKVVGNRLVDISDHKNPKVVLSGMKGAGTYKTKTLYKNGDQIKVYSSEEYKQAKKEGFSNIKKAGSDKTQISEQVQDAMGSWKENFYSEDDNRTSPTMQETLIKQKELVTQEKAFNSGWETVPKKDEDGNSIYLTPEGDVMNYFGEKIGELREGWDNTMREEDMPMRERH